MNEIEDVTSLHRFDSSRMKVGESHNGHGKILAERARSRLEKSNLNHLDLVVVGAHSCIGFHRHAEDNEEFYIVVEGTAEMQIENRTELVRPGDVIYNPPGGAHGLRNTSDYEVKLVVIEVRTPKACAPTVGDQLCR